MAMTFPDGRMQFGVSAADLTSMLDSLAQEAAGGGVTAAGAPPTPVLAQTPGPTTPPPHEASIGPAPALSNRIVWNLLESARTSAYHGCGFHR